MASHKVTAIILTYNEALNIAACLESLHWIDDVIVVDSGSQDDTIRIARTVRPDVRVFENPFEDFGQQRNWALDNTAPRHAWILFLDADERCTLPLAEEITARIATANEFAGYYLTCKNYFLGRWIRRCTLYPSWQLRLLRHGAVRYRKEGHGQREVTDGNLGYIHKPYDHFGFSQGIAHWIARHNNYSTNEVELISRLRHEPFSLGDMVSADPVRRRRASKQIASHVPLRPLARFFYLYVWRLGFMDGYAGWIFCLLRMSHEIHIVVKQAEARSRNIVA